MAGPDDSSQPAASFPAASGGTRVAYADTPAALQRWVERSLGSPVVESATQHGGFSPGVAARLRCADGRRAFLKALPSTLSAALLTDPRRPASVNKFAVDALRRETQITAALPAAVPAPAVLDAAELDDWVCLLLQDIAGEQPRLPWRRAELERVVAASDDWHEATASHSISCLRPLAHADDENFQGWQLLAADPADRRRTSGFVQRHLDELVDLERGCLAVMGGTSLLHADTRADNLLVDDDQVWFVDWPHAATGAAFLDLVAFAPSVAMQGGPAPAELLAMSRIGRAVPHEQLSPVVCAIAGYFVRQGLLPPPPGLPTVRAFQAAQGDVAMRWLRELTGWR